MDFFPSSFYCHKQLVLTHTYRVSYIITQWAHSMLRKDAINPQYYMACPPACWSCQLSKYFVRYQSLKASFITFLLLLFNLVVVCTSTAIFSRARESIAGRRFTRTFLPENDRAKCTKTCSAGKNFKNKQSEAIAPRMDGSS